MGNSKLQETTVPHLSELSQVTPGKETTRNFLPQTFRFLSSGREAKAAALHADLQTVGRLAAGVDDPTVHIAGQVTVPTLLGNAAAAEARIVPRARAARGTVQHDVTEGQELAEQAGQDAVHAAVVLGLCGDLGAGAFGAALAPLAALGGDGGIGLQLPGGVPGSSRGRGGGGGASPRERAQFGVRAAVAHPVGL